MAARLNPRNQQSVRERIQVAKLIDVLQGHAIDEKYKLSVTRIKAIEILLRKAVPDLQSIALENAGNEPFKILIANSDAKL